MGTFPLLQMAASEAVKIGICENMVFSMSSRSVFLISSLFSQVIILPVICKREVGNSFIFEG